MVTVNSLSGGKTSSRIAVEYPADVEIFALVCVDNHNAGRRIDKKLKQEVNDRLSKTCPAYPEFRATTEDVKTITAILDLEQLIGREIVWVRGIGWEEMLEKKKFIPNQQMRFCTTEMKIRPIFEYLYYRDMLPCRMRLGYRMDEIERMERATTTFKYQTHSEYQRGAQRWVNRWETMEWRVNEFPLIENQIWHWDVQEFWKYKGIDFPKDSNCQNCFWKHTQQLRKNFDTNFDTMMWAAIQEEVYGGTFRKEASLLQIKDFGIQEDFNFGTGSGCQAGFCTD